MADTRLDNAMELLRQIDILLGFATFPTEFLTFEGYRLRACAGAQLRPGLYAEWAAEQETWGR